MCANTIHKQYCQFQSVSCAIPNCLDIELTPPIASSDKQVWNLLDSSSVEMIIRSMCNEKLCEMLTNNKVTKREGWQKKKQFVNYEYAHDN